MGFTAMPTDGSSPTPLPMPSAVPDGTNTPFVTEGGPAKTTGGNTLAPVAVYQYDGYNETTGLKADAAYTDGTGAASGTGMGLFKGIFVKLAAIATAIVGTLKVKGDFSEQASLTTTGTAPTNLLGSTDVSAYKWWSLHVTGMATGGTLTFKCSNDGTNFINLTAFRLDNPSSGLVSTTTNASGTIWGGPVTFRYLEVVETAWTSGNTTGVLELYTVPPTWAMTIITVLQSGTWTVQPGNTANTTPWLVSPQVASAGGSIPYHNISAATTNFTNVKGVACQMYGCRLSNTSAAVIFVKFYDKATAPGTGDVPKTTIQVPANATIPQVFPNGLKFTSGFGWAATGAVGDADNTAIAANCVIDFDLNS